MTEEVRKIVDHFSRLLSELELKSMDITRVNGDTPEKYSHIVEVRFKDDWLKGEEIKVCEKEMKDSIEKAIEMVTFMKGLKY